MARRTGDDCTAGPRVCGRGRCHTVSVQWPPMATQSLYRRYRPQRFEDLKGQEHVVRALRTAVAEGREGQAYLFSGPRGTGKTSTARILAKVLNCSDPVDGEPCGECESCKAVESGISYDVHELDAASNSGVADIRDLIEKASLGTPGRHKVYILDEVHMLSNAAEAALLKTLEEPPDHVVFVLATTDPQKVKDTIRSRTQHLQFHLLPTDTLRDHVRWVASDAGYEVSDDAVAQVLAQGGGSARDTLSALEVVVAAGGEATTQVVLDEVVEAMLDNDAGRALAVVAGAVNQGRDPRMITDELVSQLRNRFLALMAPEQVMLPAEQIDAVADQARRLGAPRIVRSLENLGKILVEMRHAPDARVLLDVTVVQLAAEEAGTDGGALAARVQELEKRLADLEAGAPAAATTAPEAPRDPATGRAKLGGRARRSGPPTSQPAAVSEVQATPPPPPPPDVAPVADAPPTPVVGVASAEVTDSDWQAAKPALKGMARALYAGAEFVSGGASSLTLSFQGGVPLAKCEQHRHAVEAVLSEALGRAVTVELTHQGPEASARPDDPTPALAVPAPAGDEEIDLDDLVDAPPEAHKSGIDRLAEAFPGSELVEESP